MGRKADPKVPQLILRQAEHLIHLRGFHHTTLDDIAKNCGMTKANLFHHYRSKEELGLAVLDAKIAEYRSRRVSPLCSHKDPIEGVFRMFTDCTDFYNSNGCRAGCFIGNIALEMSDINEHFRKRVSEFFDEWVGGMAECLSRAQNAGTFKKSLNPKAAAETILSLYEGAVMLARTRRDASIFLRVGKMAKSLLEQHKNTEVNTHGTENTLRVLTAQK